MKLITVYRNFANTGGAQDVALLLASRLGNENDAQPTVLTRTPEASIDSAYVGRARFMQLSLSTVRRILAENPDAVFLSHDRKSTTRLMLYSRLPGLGMLRRRLVHVAHNVFDSLRAATLLPRRVVAISGGVRDNLTGYFRVPREHITFIPNGVPDRGMRPPRSGDGIRVLLMGRICPVKRQVEIARMLTGRMPAGTVLHFAGRGEQQDELAALCRGRGDVAYIGQIDPAEAIGGYDYVMLYSEREGLPLSLIEACMYGRPMITNDLPSVTDVNVAGTTGYVCATDEALVAAIASLPAPASAEYAAMANAARAHYEQHFTLPRMLEAYERLLIETAGS